MTRRPGLKSAQMYHVYNRGVSKRRIFISDKDYRFFMLQIASFKKIYAVYIKSYCIMPTHFHILLTTKEKANNISCFMKSLQLSYARYFNRTYIHSGHVFQGKFRNRSVDMFDILRIINYIKQNPVKEKLVKNAEDWPYRG